MGRHQNLVVPLRQPAQNQIHRQGLESLLRKACQEQIGLIGILPSLQPGVSDVGKGNDIRHPRILCLLLHKGGVCRGEIHMPAAMPDNGAVHQIGLKGHRESGDRREHGGGQRHPYDCDQAADAAVL